MAPSPDPGSLLLVPDVGADRGLGHLQRSLALGEAWQRTGGTAVLLAPDSATDHDRNPSEISGSFPGGELAAVRARVASAGITVVASVPRDCDWIVLDGYDVGAVDQAWARAHARHVGLIDDHGAMGRHDADLVVDQNLGATAAPYGSEADRVLLGPRYALLREAFSTPRTSSRHPGTTAGGQEQGSEVEGRAELDLVVSLGGSPSEVAVDFVADTLALLDLPAAAVATVGPVGSPTTERGEPIRSLGHPADLAEAMASARVALSAAGSTAWELCATGTPAVLVAAADNQVPIGAALADARVVDHFGPVEHADPQEAADAVLALLHDDDLWRGRRDAGRRLVDGRGADRVVTAMRALDIPLRPAAIDDARQLWTWANDPDVRAMAFDGNPIAWTDHVRWLESRLEDDTSQIYVADDEEGGAWAQVRFDGVGDGDVITDVSIDPSHRGHGLAAPLLVAATQRLRGDCAGLRQVTAKVKDGNRASLRAFAGAGFRPVGDADGVRTLEWTP